MKKVHYFCNLCREEIVEHNGFAAVFGSRKIKELQFQAFDASDCHLCRDCISFFNNLFEKKQPTQPS